MVTKSSEKVADDYCCEVCDYSTSRSDNYAKHLLTAKHKMATNGNIKVGKVGKVGESCYCCELCKKHYKSRKGLWSHNKKCSPATEDNVENTMVLSSPAVDNNLILELLKRNGDLQKQNGELQKQNGEIMKRLVEIVKEPHNNNNIAIRNNNGTVNNNNKTFNLQFFLNETCKDAINMNEFLENIKVSFEDIENLSKKGFVTGVTDVIKTEWNALEVTKRPFHCTDVKRETMYIKDNDEWNKDSENLPKMKKAVKTVAQKCRIKASEWCQTHPDIRVLDSEDNKIQLSLCEALYADTNEDKSISKSVQEIAKVAQLKKN
jgi:hypothetical protein